VTEPDDIAPTDIPDERPADHDTGSTIDLNATSCVH
jgi:hypothetical protein